MTWLSRFALTVELYAARWHRWRAWGGAASLRVSWRFA